MCVKRAGGAHDVVPRVPLKVAKRVSDSCIDINILLNRC